MKFMWSGNGYGICFASEDDGKGGGGGGGNNNQNQNNNNNQPNYEQQFKDMQSMNQKLLDRLDVLEKKGTTPPPDDKGDLADQARKKREAEEAKTSLHRQIGSAVKFITASKGWLDTNKTLLPKTIQGIFDAADKEIYADDVEKANAMKVGLVSEFFAQQANLDLLTESQKIAVEDFRKLANTVKAERVGQLYDQIFEPTFEGLKRMKKAELLSKGQAAPSDSEKALLEKRQLRARKHFLGEKK